MRLSRARFMASAGFVCLLSGSSMFVGCAGARIDQMERDLKAAKNDVADLRELQAEQSSSINQLRAEIRGLSGKMEEVQHVSVGKTQQLEQTLRGLQARVPPPPGVPEDLLNADEEKISSITGPAADVYRSGLAQVRGGDFDGAKQTLAGFIETNPGTAFTDNALFWMGIVYGKLGQPDKSIGAFSEVFQKYPAEDMVAPSLLYLAEELLKLGSKEDAILTLQKLVDEHGRSSYATRARERLAELRGSGRAPRKKVR